MVIDRLLYCFNPLSPSVLFFRILEIYLKYMIEDSWDIDVLIRKDEILLYALKFLLVLPKTSPNSLRTSRILKFLSETRKGIVKIGLAVVSLQLIVKNVVLLFV